MTASPETLANPLFAYLDTLQIAHTTHWHDATFTVEEGAGLKASLPGGHTKNLFLKDKDAALILIAAEAHNTLKLNQLHKVLGTRRLSFGKAGLMQGVLGVSPGSVTAFALMNDTAQRVRFIVDTALLTHDLINFHPLTNRATTAISRMDFERFVLATGHRFEGVDFSQL